MATQMKLCVLAAFVGLLFVSTAASAQNPPATSPLRTIGVPASAKPDVVPSLIVLNARGAVLQNQVLTLTGVAPNSIVFADRPVRSAGHDLTTHIVEDWGTGADNFAKDPPNATVSVFSKDGSTVKDAVVVLQPPKLDGDKLIFPVQILEGDLNGADGAAAVFIDIIGRPFTPLSFAGVARRTAYRGAFYGGAALAGAAAVGTAAAYGAYGPYGPYAPAYRPPCGYYPAPPCY
jgi:hypothetical protein